LNTGRFAVGPRGLGADAIISTAGETTVNGPLKNHREVIFTQASRNPHAASVDQMLEKVLLPINFHTSTERLRR
jgi:hypothetical protein